MLTKVIKLWYEVPCQPKYYEYLVLFFRSRRSTPIHQLLKKKRLSQRASWSLSPVVDSSNGGLIKTANWTLTPSKPLVRCHSKWIADILINHLLVLTVSFLQACFRELCGLCWMLHVRDQLSISCRKYQAARQHGRDEQVFNLCLIVFHVYV